MVGSGHRPGRRAARAARIAWIAGLAGVAGALPGAGAGSASAAGQQAAFAKREPFDPARLRRLGRGDYARMDAARARELLAAATVTRRGRTDVEPAAAAEVDRFLAESRRLAAGAAAEPEESAPVEPRVVIGRDERVRVGDTRRLPYRAIGAVAGLACTGTLIGRRHVLTAAHCVYNFGRRAYYRDVDFAPARDGSLRPYGVVPWTKIYAPRGYTEQGLARFDYALVVLARPVGDTVGALPFGPRSSLGGATLNVTGYPSDKPDGTLWRSRCPSEGVRGNGQLFYACDTAPGTSGAPVYVGGGARPTVHAVHTTGYASEDINAGTPITSAIKGQLQAWIRAN